LKSFQKIIISICLLLNVLNLTAQERTVVSGLLLNVVDSTAITEAHIINLTAQRGVISNTEGKFEIRTNPYDSVLISVIGYYPLTIIAENLTDIIYLEERNYELELYNVIPYKNFDEFKIAFANLDLPDTERKVNSTIYLTREELVGMGHTGSGIIFTGVISGILASFNKHMKDKANYEMLLLRDKYEAFLATKFNPDLVKRIVELNDIEKLNDFIAYCDFNNDFIAKNNNYTIITQIFDCYDEYIALPLASK